MSSKKGTTLPLDQFLKPNPKITNWAEDEDFDADCKSHGTSVTSFVRKGAIDIHLIES